MGPKVNDTRDTSNYLRLPRWQFGMRTLFVLVTVSAAIMSAAAWYLSPSRRTQRLLEELADQPGGHIDLGWSGRPTEAILADFRILGSAAVPELICALRSPKSDIRYLAAGQLGDLKDPRAVEPLIVCLQQDDNAVVQMWAAIALGKIGDPQAVQPLLDYVREADGSGRWAAKQSLSKIAARNNLDISNFEQNSNER